MARLAWFSPMPPARSGVAACSRDLITALRDQHDIDAFVDDALAGGPADAVSAHDFLWRHRQAPYDLVVYQVGNSSCHDYLWPYLFRFPGLTVLHDVRLHHARAASLLRRGRTADYRREFAANHPDVDADLAEIAVAGFDTPLYYDWPMTRVIAATSRMVAVHTATAAAELERDVPEAAVRTIHLGHGVALEDDERLAARRRGRARWSIPADTLMFGCFGGLTPDKRIPQILRAFAATLTYAPSARLLLAGAPVDHSELRADIHRLGLASRVIVTGYLEHEDQLTEAIAASDASLNLRWPTAGEVSGPWLRCLALGLATVIVDLAHLSHVPALDPRTWQPHGGATGESPVAVAIDIMDEDHSLALAMRRLAAQPALRDQLGRAGAAHWQRHHSPGLMVEDYRALVAEAIESEVPAPHLPAHLLTDGRRVLDEVTGQFGLSPLLR